MKLLVACFVVYVFGAIFFIKSLRTSSSATIEETTHTTKTSRDGNHHHHHLVVETDDINDTNDDDAVSPEVDKGDDAMDTDLLNSFVTSTRKPLYKSWPLDPEGNEMPYDINNCPEIPPDNYPIEWPLLELLHNWIPDDTTFPSLAERPSVYQGLCRFDYRTEYHKAEIYREAEVPFILRDDPQILSVAERWARPGYLSSVLGKVTRYLTEYSESNHLMYFKASKNRKKKKDYKPPITNIKMTYDQWAEKANQPDDEMGPDKPHWYFRVSAKDKEENDIMFQEMPFFKSKTNFYIVDKHDTRGINCRFGMKGNIAEAHYDSSRNFVALFGGERRYILSHPKNCKNLALYPFSHPSGRHTALDWSAPDLEAHPEFADANANEVVLQAGDVLYLPTYWFHHIISLDFNWQCNARSGDTDHYTRDISKCGL